MKLNVYALKQKFILLFILAFALNANSQKKIIYQTGFENILNKTMLGQHIANDGWLVNDTSVQDVAPNNYYYPACNPTDDEFRNCFAIESDWYKNTCQGDQ